MFEKWSKIKFNYVSILSFLSSIMFFFKDYRGLILKGDVLNVYNI